MIDEFVLRGNSATLKCLIPSFIADFVHVSDWISDDGEEYVPSTNETGNCFIIAVSKGI